jgi:hypothetical protein
MMRFDIRGLLDENGGDIESRYVARHNHPRGDPCSSCHRRRGRPGTTGVSSLPRIIEDELDRKLSDVLAKHKVPEASPSRATRCCCVIVSNQERHRPPVLERD